MNALPVVRPLWCNAFGGGPPCLKKKKAFSSPSCRGWDGTVMRERTWPPLFQRLTRARVKAPAHLRWETTSPGQSQPAPSIGSPHSAPSPRDPDCLPSKPVVPPSHRPYPRCLMALSCRGLGCIAARFGRLQFADGCGSAPGAHSPASGPWDECPTRVDCAECRAGLGRA